jgi:hypothetical protein
MMLTWTRIAPGHYRAGQWTVTRVESTPSGMNWVLEMAGVRRGRFATMAEAKAHAARIVGNGR